VYEVLTTVMKFYKRSNKKKWYRRQTQY